MPARKRGRQEADLDNNNGSMAAVEAPKANDTLAKLRNMSEFAAFMQYLFLFGKVVKVDEDFDIDVSDGRKRHLDGTLMIPWHEAMLISYIVDRSSRRSASGPNLQDASKRLVSLF